MRRILLTELGGAGLAEQPSHCCRSEPTWMLSDLLLAIRGVDEVIHSQEEVWHAGLCDVVGLECDPILAETPVQLGSNAS